MARLSSLLFVVLIAVVLISVSADNITYNVTLVPCVPDSTCPEGNLAEFNLTFALNGTLSPDLTLNVGDQLVFDLETNTEIHPLLICQNSAPPSFCAGVVNGDILSTPITTSGATTSFTFTTAGTYYYGCHYHPGMGATINVVESGGPGGD